MDVDFIVRRDVHKHHTQSNPLPPVKLMLALGLNDKAQLAVGNFEEPTKEIELVNMDKVFGNKSKEIVKVVCGGYHTMILMDDGSVYGVGENSNGQLGTGDLTLYCRPRRVTLIPPIMDVFCGSAHTFFLTSNNLLFDLTLLQQVEKYGLVVMVV